MTIDHDLKISDAVLGVGLTAHTSWIVLYMDSDDELTCVGIFESWARGTGWQICNLPDTVKSAVIPIEKVSDAATGQVILQFQIKSINSVGVFADEVELITWYADNNSTLEGQTSFAPFRKVA